MKDLSAYRDEIDDIDRQIIELLSLRKQCVEMIATLKKEQGMGARQPTRFSEVVKRCRELAVQNNLDPNVIESIWNELHEYFVSLEETELKSD
jgi:isochorismate pyruvate lyase